MDKRTKKYEAVIGLEIHAELKTNSKMFCSCANSTTRIDTNEGTNKYESKPVEPNINVCPVCLGMPGMLPVLNKQAIECTILTGLALNCQIGHPINADLCGLNADYRGNDVSVGQRESQRQSASMTKWDRKNYFYPDLPKGYQISQYDLPLCSGGHIEITKSKLQITNKSQISNLKSQTNKIGITRIHLEEDTGTSKHPEGRADVDYSLMDYNRAGVPLMELVTEPDIESAKEAKEFCQKYQLILRYLGVADADMEKGQLRCEINISLRRNPKFQIPNPKQISNSNDKNSKLGTKVEIKNLNSFKSVEKAIEYEIGRQSELLDQGEKIIQETRGWDDAKSKTYTMRIKETSADYRYFPEPDLPPVVLRTTKRKTKNEKLKTDEIIIGEIRKQLPELPDEKIQRYIELAVSEYNARIIVSDVEIARSFEKTCQMSPPEMYSLIADWYVNIIKNSPINEELLVELLSEIDKGKINRGIAKDILPDVIKGKSPSEIIKEKGLEQIIDERAIEKIVNQVLSKNSVIVEKIKSGQTQVMGFLVGQVMRESKGQANPQVVNEILKDKLI